MDPTERIEARLTGPLTFRADPNKVGDADELRMEEDLGVRVLNRDVPLGTGGVRVPLSGIEVGPRGGDGLAPVTAQAQQERLVFDLSPPAGRRHPAKRTQSSSKPLNRGSAELREVLEAVGARPGSRDMTSVLATLDRRGGNAEGEPATQLLQQLREDRLD